MQGLILAAGMGKRLKELTEGNTKCMVKVNGITLIERALRQLMEANIKKVIIVIGYEGKKLMKFLEGKFPSLELVYVHNEIYDKTNNIYSLYLAKDYLFEDDTILLESDLIYEDSVITSLINHPYPNVSVAAKYEAWMDGTVVLLDSEDYILDFLPKRLFKYSDIDQYYKTVNVYKFSKDFSRTHYVPFLEAYIKSMGENEYYEQVLRVISHLDTPVIKALPLGKEKWYEIDDVQDLDIAEAMFSEGEEKFKKFNARYGGYWRFPEVKDYCYLVNPYFPPQKMLEELKAFFDVLVREYPSGMEVNSLLAAKYFGLRTEHILVGNGAAELIKTYLELNNVTTGISYPSFEEYHNRLSKDNIIAFHPNNDDFTYTVDELISFYQDKPIKQLLLINPDNPSGNFIPKNEVLRLAQWAQKKNIILILDESFVDFSDNGGPENTLLHIDILLEYKNLIIIKSISKSYGVAGLRLGVLASSNLELIQMLKKQVSIWNINSIGEYYMQIFGKYESQYKKACTLLAEERSRFHNELATISFLRPIPSAANYIIAEVKEPYSANSIAVQMLHNAGIFLKDISSKVKNINGKQYLRIAVKSTEDNNYLIKQLKAIKLFE